MQHPDPRSPFPPPSQDGGHATDFAATQPMAGYAAERPVSEAAAGQMIDADLAQRHAELQAKHTEVSDAYLRAKAEVENVRRRADEEIAKGRKFAIESFAENLLPVVDSLEAAVAAGGVPTDPVSAAMLEGVHATLRQLLAALERSKVVQVNPAVGEKFDPHRHQAISVVPAAQEPNTVVNVLQRGYTIADRVLRPALVMVTAPR